MLLIYNSSTLQSFESVLLTVANKVSMIKKLLNECSQSTNKMSMDIIEGLPSNHTASLGDILYVVLINNIKFFPLETIEYPLKNKFVPKKKPIADP